MADQGAFGKVYLVKQSEKHFGRTRLGSGRATLGRRRLHGHGCHGIAFCYWFLGRPKIQKVLCHMGTYVHGAKTQGEDDSVCILDFEMAPKAWWRTVGPARRHGGSHRGLWEGGLTYADLHMATPCRPTANTATATRWRRRPAHKAGAGRSSRVVELRLPQEMRHFARCVRGKETPQATGEDGRVVQEACTPVTIRLELAGRSRCPSSPPGSSGPSISG